jgi:hypothetical protein
VEYTDFLPGAAGASRVFRVIIALLIQWSLIPILGFWTYKVSGFRCQVSGLTGLRLLSLRPEH